MDYTVVNGKNLSQMTLGTVQLGLNYGIANEGGQPELRQSHAMLSCALENGVSSLDTARAYGTSEVVLGSFLKIIPQNEIPFLTSKLIVGLPETASEAEVEKSMFESVETSLATLGISKLDCLMLHRGEEMTKHGKSVPNVLKKMVTEGYTSMVGVSVYEPEELDIMLQNDVYQATQLPMSLFDQKWIHQGYLEKLSQNNITVFVRSVFLQGLFFLNPAAITDPLLVEYARPYLLKLSELCERENVSIAEFAISFIRDLPGVTSLVLGADTDAQVFANIGYMNAPALSEKVRHEALEVFKDVNLEKIMEVLRRPKN